MKLERLDGELSVCKVPSVANIDLDADFFFIGKTDEEVSLVCRTADVPADTCARDDGWHGMRVQGVLEFSLTGILAQLSDVLARAGVGIFAVSTYNTDYILVKAENFEKAVAALEAAGHTFA